MKKVILPKTSNSSSVKRRGGVAVVVKITNFACKNKGKWTLSRNEKKKGGGGEGSPGSM